MKTVILVGGTAYSGSTFFNMILGNDPKAFACGEIRSLFKPSRSQHVELQCGCGDENCTIWGQLGTHAERSLYERLFRLLPEIDYIVDSSKNPFWIQTQNRRLHRQGIRVKNILIWKTPLEFAFSCKKRNRFSGWDRRWIEYHQLYFSMVEPWRAVAYSSLVHDRQTLKNVCQYLEMPYFEGKERYWEKAQHSLFGNYSARFHLYSKEGAEEFLAGSIDEERLQDYRQVYYKNVEDEALRGAVEGKIRESRAMKKILLALEQQDVNRRCTSTAAARSLILSTPYVLLRKAWQDGKAYVDRRKYAQRKLDIARRLRGYETGL